MARCILLLALGLAAGCAPSLQSGGSHRAALIKQAGVAPTCEGSSRTEDRPFVVTWDGTDVAEFEALAQRDTVFVRYVGCKLDVIRTCRNDQIPGELGAYGQPVITSGTNNTVEINDQNELHARLPLGVVSFGAKVAEGASLRLTYHVAGVAQDDRERVYAQELAKARGCDEVTHFVRAYNIGAFSLETANRNAAGGSVDVKNVGAGASHSASERRLASAGDLASCDTGSKLHCRVPIRLVLERITPGAPPPDAHARLQQPRLPSAADDYQAWKNQIDKIEEQAKQALHAGDATTCLRTLSADPGFDERAGRNDPDAAKYVEAKGWWLELKSHCLAASGACQEARKVARSSLELIWGHHPGFDRELREREDDIDRYCTAARKTNDQMSEAVRAIGDADAIATRAANPRDKEICTRSPDDMVTKFDAVKDTPLGHLAAAHIMAADVACDAAKNRCANLDRRMQEAVDAEAKALAELGRTAGAAGYRALSAWRDATLQSLRKRCNAGK